MSWRKLVSDFPTGADSAFPHLGAAATELLTGSNRSHDPATQVWTPATQMLTGEHVTRTRNQRHDKADLPTMADIYRNSQTNAAQNWRKSLEAGQKQANFARIPSTSPQIGRNHANLANIARTRATTPEDRQHFAKTLRTNGWDCIEIGRHRPKLDAATNFGRLRGKCCPMYFCIRTGRDLRRLVPTIRC